MILLIVSFCVALVVARIGALNTLQSRNLASVQRARLAAESGLGFLGHVLRACEAPPGDSGEALCLSVAQEIDRILAGTPNLGGASVRWDGETAIVPAVSLDSGTLFDATVSVPAGKTIRVTVTGYDSRCGTRRAVRMDFEVVGGVGSAILSKGPIVFDNSTWVRSLHQPLDASITCCAPDYAITFYNDSSVDGDLSLTDPDARVLSVDRLSVGGDIRVGVDPVEFPEFDIAPLAALAVNVVDEHTDVSSGTFRNIRVKAGTNPQFGSVSIEGVMYVEVPNVIALEDAVTITGAIVTEDPGPGASQATHQIYFDSSVTFGEPSTLPDIPEFAAVRELSGSYIIAPGFFVNSQNGLSGAIGVIAADRVRSDNALGATLYGAIIAYGDGGIHFIDDCTISVDRANWKSGDLMSPRIRVLPQTYTEIGHP
jgi:hypothetical protein